MRTKKHALGSRRRKAILEILPITVRFHAFFCLLLLIPSMLIFSCGYQMVGSKPLPFDSIAIRPIHNNTYEPRLEERLYNALAKEFIAQGIKVASSGDTALEATVTAFELSSIAAIDEKVQEQAIAMRVDVKIIDKEQTIEFMSMESPIRITFKSTGTVSESVLQKERATDKACYEIAREIISKIIIRYAE